MAVDIAKIRVGDKVYHQPSYHLKDDKWENGIVKEVPEGAITAIRVVFHCAGEWKNFKNYTSQLTEIKDLFLGWKH